MIYKYELQVHNATKTQHHSLTINSLRCPPSFRGFPPVDQYPTQGPYTDTLYPQHRMPPECLGTSEGSTCTFKSLWSIYQRWFGVLHRSNAFLCWFHTTHCGVSLGCPLPMREKMLPCHPQRWTTRGAGYAPHVQRILCMRWERSMTFRADRYGVYDAWWAWWYCYRGKKEKIPRPKQLAICIPMPSSQTSLPHLSPPCLLQRLFVPSTKVSGRTNSVWIAIIAEHTAPPHHHPISLSPHHLSLFPSSLIKQISPLYLCRWRDKVNITHSVNHCASLLYTTKLHRDKAMKKGRDIVRNVCKKKEVMKGMWERKKND